MQHSEAREIRSSSGSIRIFRASGEGWRALSSEVPSHEIIRTLRSGPQQLYASDSFIAKFCHEAGIIPQPEGDDLLLIPAENISSFDAEQLDSISVVVWSDDARAAVPVLPAAAQHQHRFELQPTGSQLLRSISLDFMEPLKLPDGTDPPISANNWQYGLTDTQLSKRQRDFADAIERTFSDIPGPHRRLGASMALKVRKFIQRYMGVLMGQLKMRRSETTSLQLANPYNLAYYFRFVAASKKPGRNFQQSTLRLEVDLMSHFVEALRTHALKETLGLRMDQLQTFDIDSIVEWIRLDMMHAVSWKRCDAGRGARRQEREVVNRLVTEAQYDAWEADVLKQARDLMTQKDQGLMARNSLTATDIQDLFCCLCLGPGKPPLRADVLRTLQHPSSRRGCPVPGCGVGNCIGNRIMTGDELRQLTGQNASETTSSAYAIVCGHYKNYSGNRASYRGPKVFTAASLGAELAWMLTELVDWASPLLHGLHGSDEELVTTDDDDSDDSDDEEEPVPVLVQPGSSSRTARRYLLTDYDSSGPFFVKRSSDSIRTRTPDAAFTNYIKTITYPLCQPPTSFRFLFARAAERRIENRGVSHLQAEELRHAFATEMLTSLEKWKTVYARPVVRLTHSAYEDAFAILREEGTR